MHTPATTIAIRSRVVDRAILFFVFTLLLATTIACGGSPTAPEAEARPRIASVIVKPGVAALEPTESLRFTADVRDADGRPVAAQVTWEATGGAIDSRGLYTAGQSSGEYQVRAISVGEVIGFARIKIEELFGNGSDDGDPSGSDDGDPSGSDDGDPSGSDDGDPSGSDDGDPGQGDGGSDDGDTSGGDPSDPPQQDAPQATSLTVTPHQATVDSGGSIQFSVDLRDQYGDPMSDPVQWSATGGRITSTGFYTAGSQAGDFTVTARAAGLVDRASVTIVVPQPQPQPTTLTISPATVTVDAGGTVQFSADLRDQNGHPMSDPVQWSANGGSITSTGLYTAGSQAGDHTVTAHASGLSASATVTIQAPTSQPQINGVPIQPGESIQSAVDANPSGTTFVIKAGIHSRQSVEPKDGTTFVGENGAVLDGGGIGRFAFGSYGPGARGVTVKNLEIRNYQTSIDEGAIQGDNTRDWVLEGNDIHHNGGFGVRGGPGMRVLNNHTHHNGDAGIHGYKADGMIVDGNEVDHNGDAGVQSGQYATAAGMKFFKIRDLVVRNNYVHDNGARGIWCDTDCYNVRIEGNRVIDNGGFGIWIEISYKTVVFNNHVERNGFADYDGPGWLGGAGIAVSNSPDVEVARNTLIDNADGIAGMQATGYPSSGAYGAYQLRNLWVHDNTVKMSHGRTGISTNGGDAVFDNWNNRFDRNTYTLSDDDAFAWKNGTRKPGEWQGYGQDPNGSFN